MHSVHNYNNQRNQENRNLGGKSKENRSNESNYGGSNKSAPTNKSMNEKSGEHSSTIDKQSMADDKTHNKMPILNEKIFASKCTISSSGADASKNEQNEQCDSNRPKEDSKESSSSSNKTSKNSSTESDQQQATAGQDETNTGSCSLNTKNSTLNQVKVGPNYPTSIQQSTAPTNSSKFSGTQVPNRVFVGGISTDTTENELQSLFSQFGNIKATKIIIDREGVPKGYGFITFTTEEEANKVLKESDNLVLKNRKLNVAIAVKKQSSNPNLGNSTNLSRNFADLNQYNMFYMPNGISSIPAAYMNEYPISFPEMYHPYASPHLTAAGLPNSGIPNPPFAPYPLVYRPSSLYFHPSTAAVSMHPSTSTHPQNATGLPMNLQQGQTNAQDTNQYSGQQAAIQSQQAHSTQTQQTNQSQQVHHHSSRLNSNNSNPNSNQMANSGAGNQTDGGYQSQYHLHHMNNHLNAHHQHLSHHHSHQPSHAQSNMAVTSNTSNANQQHTPVFIANTGMPYVHPLSLQYNHGLASIATAGAFSANTTQPHQTSLTHQSHYTHPLSSQHSQQAVNQFQMNPNWNSQWR